MPDQDIFNTNSDNTNSAPNPLEILVGEGKKYKTMEDLAKAYLNADEHISTLTGENAALREQVTKATTIEEVMERLNKQGQSHSQNDNSATTGSLTPEDVRKLVTEAVTGLETSKTRTDNMKRANALMQEHFGEKAGAVFKEVAKTPELEKLYKELAQVDPDEFIRRFADVPKNTTQTDSGSTTNTPTIPVGNGGRINQIGTKEYYDNIRRTKPGLYYSSDFQLEMDKVVRGNKDLYYGRK